MFLHKYMRYEHTKSTEMPRVLPFVGVNFVHNAPPTAEEHFCIP